MPLSWLWISQEDRQARIDDLNILFVVIFNLEFVASLGPPLNYFVLMDAIRRRFNHHDYWNCLFDCLADIGSSDVDGLATPGSVAMVRHSAYASTSA